MTSQDGTPWVEDDATPKSRGEAQRALREGRDIAGTISEKYLSEIRRVPPPYPPDFKHLDNARTGESALVAPLYSNEEIVAVQLIYLDADGNKSKVEPAKQRFSIKPAPDAVFKISDKGDSKKVAIAEGVEDGLTVWHFGLLRCPVRGLPGIGALKHLKFPEDTTVIVVTDGDPPGSKGAEQLQNGLDALILCGCNVFVTATPPEGWDCYVNVAPRIYRTSSKTPGLLSSQITARSVVWRSSTCWRMGGSARKLPRSSEFR